MCKLPLHFKISKTGKDKLKRLSSSINEKKYIYIKAQNHG